MLNFLFSRARRRINRPYNHHVPEQFVAAVHFGYDSFDFNYVAAVRYCINAVSHSGLHYQAISLLVR